LSHSFFCFLFGLIIDIVETLQKLKKMMNQEHEIIAMTDDGSALLAARSNVNRLVIEVEQLHDEQIKLRRQHAAHYARLEQQNDLRENRLKRENEELTSQLEHALDEVSGAAFEDAMANDRARREEDKKAAQEAADRLNEQEERERKRAAETKAEVKANARQPNDEQKSEDQGDCDPEGVGNKSVYFDPPDGDDDLEL
jgi:hypothetical protein